MRTLILVRHAHRNKPAPLGRKADNGLSKKGKAQAREMLRRYRKCFGKKRPVLISSPKLRCVETLEPLSQWIKARITTSDSLEEQGAKESDRDYHERILKFVGEWQKNKAKLTVLCGHGDLFPLLTQELTGCAIELKKGGWIELAYDGTHYQIIWVLQKL